MSLALTDDERAWLGGEDGKATQFAMQLVVKAAEIMGAERLIPISFAHIDACFFTGQPHIDFVKFLLANGASLRIPTWTNNSVASEEKPELRPVSCNPAMVSGAHQLMRLYAELGCKPTWTCAPYQLRGGPELGDQIAAAESNAVTFYNSAVGARTNKYGAYLDVACAITGLAPYAGLHTDAGRKADLHFSCEALPERWKKGDAFFHLLGHHVGRVAGQRIPVITGLLPETTSDNLKALCTASAASGGVALLHVVGVTPEARTLEGISRARDVIAVLSEDIMRAQNELTTARDGPLDCVALGTPHFSVTEFAALVAALGGRRVKAPMLVSTSRGVRELIRAKGWFEILEAAGVSIPVDVCTYYSPKISALKGRVMTNAAKWAYYAPGMLGVEVCFGSLKECVESAVKGEVWREPGLWGAA